MNSVMVKEVERFLYIPNIKEKSKTRALVFLSLTKFNQDSQTDLAGKLIILYFNFFKVSIKKGEIESKMMSTILNGINRAFPYSKLDVSVLDENINTIYKLIHMVHFNLCVQAFQLLYSLLDAKGGLSDRFYTALYSKIVDPALGTAKNKVDFLHILYNSMKRDSEVTRIRSFIKRTLQVTKFLPVNCAAGLLIIVSELLKERKDLKTTSTQPVGSGADLSR